MGGAGPKRRVIGKYDEKQKIGTFVGISQQKASEVTGDLCAWRVCEAEVTYEFILFH